MLNALKQAANDQANALVMTLKGAEAAQTFANGTGSPSGAANSLGNAITPT